jgi:hypothetical protein
VTLQSDVSTSGEKCKPRKEFCEEKIRRCAAAPTGCAVREKFILKVRNKRGFVLAFCLYGGPTNERKKWMHTKKAGETTGTDLDF